MMKASQKRFDEEINRRMNDPLWGERMHRAVMHRVRSRKRRQLAAAVLLFTAMIGITGYVGARNDQYAELDSLSSLLNPMSWFLPSSDEAADLASEHVLEWTGLNRFPVAEDEELSIVLGSNYYE